MEGNLLRDSLTEPDSNLGISQSATSKTASTFSLNFLSKTKILKDNFTISYPFSKVLFKLKFNWGIRGNAMHNLFSEFHQFEKTCDAKDIKKKL